MFDSLLAHGAGLQRAAGPEVWWACAKQGHAFCARRSSVRAFKRCAARAFPLGLQQREFDAVHRVKSIERSLLRFLLKPQLLAPIGQYYDNPVRACSGTARPARILDTPHTQ